MSRHQDGNCDLRVPWSEWLAAGGNAVQPSRSRVEVGSRPPCFNQILAESSNKNVPRSLHIPQCIDHGNKAPCNSNSDCIDGQQISQQGHGQQRMTLFAFPWHRTQLGINMLAAPGDGHHGKWSLRQHCKSNCQDLDKLPFIL